MSADCSLVAVRRDALGSSGREVRRTDLGGLPCYYLPISADLAHVHVWADIVEDADPQEAVQTVWEVFAQLRTAVPGQLFETDRERFLANAELEGSRLGLLEHRAFERLIRGPGGDSDDPLERLRDLEPDDIATHLDAALGNSLWVLPAGTDPPADFDGKALAEPIDPPVQGQEHDPRIRRPGEPVRRLVAGPKGVTAEFDRTEAGSARWHTLRFDRCVAVLGWNDRSRGLIAEDGTSLV